MYVMPNLIVYVKDKTVCNMAAEEWSSYMRCLVSGSKTTWIWLNCGNSLRPVINDMLLQIEIYTILWMIFHSGGVNFKWISLFKLHMDQLVKYIHMKSTLPSSVIDLSKWYIQGVWVENGISQWANLLVIHTPPVETGCMWISNQITNPVLVISPVW